MNKRKIFLLLIISIVGIGSKLFYIKIGWLMIDRTGLEPKKMGYCFDVAFDPEKERLIITAGQGGLHILNINDGQLEYLTTYYDEGYYRNLKVHGERVFVADSKKGFRVFDISGETPLSIWVQANTEACGLHIESDLAYVAACKNGLQIFDITNPDSPVFLGSLQTPGSAWDIWMHDGFAYIADFHAGMTVIDVTKPTNPILVGTTTWADRHQSAEIVRGEGNVVFIAAGLKGLIVLDISDPYQPIVASIYRPTRLGYAEGLAVKGGILYLAWGSEFLRISTVENGLHILDVSDPYAPKLLSKAQFTDWVEGVYVDSDFAYIANTFNGARSINIQDVFQPYVANTFDKLP
jgi:hypothetical protein